jgi:8-oxo-dGTP pyrophosphatase MutT (NUDIX family)
MSDAAKEAMVAARAAGLPSRSPRPRDAATLLITRRRGGCVEVLMGERHQRHSVHPQRYVFPGGKVDRHDARVRAAVPPPGEVMELLTRRATPGRARALIAAAVRETFEETGLLIGAPDPQPGRAVHPHWQPFFASGLAPDFSRLTYIARAVTPVGRPVRFNVRFFMIGAQHVRGELGGNGELLNLQYVPVAEGAALDMPNITRRILAHVDEITRQAEPVRLTAVPCFRYGGTAHRRIEE